MLRSITSAFALAAIAGASLASAAETRASEHVLYGIITRVSNGTIVVQRRDGSRATIDISPAEAAGTTGVLYVSRPVAIAGEVDRSGRFHAEAIRSWYGLRRGDWPADR